jgi:hypothetical protein
VASASETLEEKPPWKQFVRTGTSGYFPYFFGLFVE